MRMKARGSVPMAMRSHQELSRPSKMSAAWMATSATGAEAAHRIGGGSSAEKHAALNALRRYWQ